MAGISTLRTIVGFGLKGLGFFWSLSDKFVCNSLCNGSCPVFKNNQCSLLLLFAGIIFIVSGYALIVMKDKQRTSFKKKIKKNLRLLK